MTVNIKVGAQLDTGDISRQLDELTRRINATGQTIARQSGQQFQPISKATVDQLQRVEGIMRNISRLAPQVAARLKASGQQGTSLFDVDWKRAYTDPHAANRAASGVFTMATGLGFQAPPAPPPPPRPAPPQGGGGGGGRTPPPSRPAPPPPPSPLGQAVNNTFHRGLQAAGPLGGVASSGIRAGQAGGFSAGAMGFAGAAVGLGVSALIGGVRQYVGQAQETAIGIHDLRNRMGGTGQGNGFFALRDGMRRASNNAEITYGEARGYANTFARHANVTGTAELEGAVSHAAGFGRAFGFEPGSSVQAFAGLRGVGATRSTEDSRRLGAMIAEGIARAGVFGKAEEYLAEIASFGEQQTRASLGPANMEGYAGAMTGLLAQRRPGLDVQGSARLLDRANSALQRGGAQGEASQAFTYHMMSRNLGASPYETLMMQEGGAFATGEGTFGPNTVAGDYLRAHGQAPSARLAGDRRTMLQMTMQGLRARYRDPRQLADAVSQHLGLSMSQAMAFEQMQPEQLGRMQEVLGPEQMGRLSATGIQATARIVTGGRDVLDRYADDYQARTGADRLNASEAGRLSGARARLNEDPTNTQALEEYRRVLAEISAGRGEERTQGNETRRLLQGIDKTLEDLAAGLISPLNTARDALLIIAGRGNGALTATEARRQRVAAEVAEIDEAERAAIDPMNAGVREARAARARAQSEALALVGTPQETEAQQRLAAAEERVRTLEAERARVKQDMERRRQGVRSAGRMEERSAEGAAEGRARLDALREGAQAGTTQRRERSNADFAREFGPAAQGVAERLGVPVEAVLGHWAHETNRGRAFAGENNLGNLTALPGQDATAGGDRDAAGNPIRQRFRNFNNIPEFAQAYASWVERRAPGARGAATPEAFFAEMQRGGYATAPNFVSATSATARGFRNLPLPPPAPPAPAVGQTPMPAGAAPDAVQNAPGGGAAGPQRVSGVVEGVFRLEDQRGQQMAQPIRVVTGWGPARPFGATG